MCTWRRDHWRWCSNRGGTVVTRDVPPYAIVVGNPGKIIKYRFADKVIQLLLEARWWDWPHAFIKENINMFHQDVCEDIAERMVEISKRVIS